MSKDIEEIARLREALQAISNGQRPDAAHRYRCLCSRCAMPPGELRRIALTALNNESKPVENGHG